MQHKMTPCRVCGKPLLVLANEAEPKEPTPAESSCPECQELSEAYESHQRSLRDVLLCLPSDAELGAIVRQRLLALLSIGTDDELGAFARLIYDGRVEDLAQLGVALMDRIEN